MDRQILLANLLDRLGLPVPEAARARLLWFLDELLRWNRKVNLTAITDPQDAVEKHLVDSLTVLPFLHSSERLLDIGSGGGFPGIPLKLVRPELRLVSVDSAGKKIAFQRHVARQLGLPDFLPLAARVEDLPQQAEFQGGFDVIVTRAFASITEFARRALPLLAPEGFLLAMKGGEGEGELQAAEADLQAVGLTPKEVHSLHLPASGSRRTLILLHRS
jgi:16S rRNA (guanine527-N7)-methyltransferase